MTTDEALKAYGRIVNGLEAKIDVYRTENDRMRKLLEDIRNNAWLGNAFGKRIDEAITRADTRPESAK